LESWDPFNAPGRILARFGGRFESGWPGDALLEEAENHRLPPADVYEDAEGWHVLVELPGVQASELAVTLLDDCLIVEAERLLPNGNNLILREVESRYGAFRREFLLPSRSVPTRALADLSAGVLHVLVPRLPSATSIARPLAFDGDVVGSHGGRLSLLTPLGYDQNRHRGDS
jgi:HSP20 family protein